MIVECYSCLRKLHEDDEQFHDNGEIFCEDCAPQEVIDRGNVCSECDDDFLEKLCLMCNLCEACCECGHEDE